MNVEFPCDACPLRALPAFRAFSPEELAFMDRFKQGELHLEAGGAIFHENTSSPHVYTVVKGWAFRYKTLPDGRRQRVVKDLPGDLIGLQAVLHAEMAYGADSLTPVLLCVLPRTGFEELFRSHPSLAFDVTWLASNEERLLDEGLLSVGRRTALERLAFLLWNLHHRARRAGLGGDGPVPFPLTQSHVADTLGLSLVHVNKTLKRLRDSGAVSWTNGSLEVRDEQRLMELGVVSPPEEGPRPFL